MTLEGKARQYAREHPQEVTLAWIDGSKRTYDADRAVRLCTIPRIAACIMGAQAEDQQLAAMLNWLVDEAE